MSLLTPVLTDQPVPAPSTVQREPLVVVGAIVAILQYIVSEWDGLAALLLSLGVPPETISLILTIVTVALTILGVFVGRKFVTPLSSPVNADGEKLTPA